jgi:hypothetical protein
MKEGPLVPMGARRAVAAAAVLLAALIALPLQLAGAASGGNGQGTQNTTSASWAVVATQSAAVPPPVGPLTLSFSTNATQYFSVVNSGTVQITGSGYTVTLTASGGKPRLTLSACSVPWDQTSGTCGGTQSTIATWRAGTSAPPGQVPSGTTVDSPVAPVSPGAALYLAAQPVLTGHSTLSAVVETAVSSGPTRQIRAPVTTFQ